MMYVVALVLEFFDDITAQILDAGIGAFIGVMRTPMWICLVLWLVFRAWQAMTGNLQAMATDALKEGVGVIAAVCLATNVDLFNQYVRDFFFHGVPSYLGGAAARIVSPQAGAVQAGTMGEQLTVLWAMMWRECGRMFQSLSITSMGDWVMGAAIVILIFVAGLFLAVCAFVYVISHFFLSIIVMLGPLFIGISVFRATRPFLDRWLGKTVALILVQVVAVVVLAVVVRGSMLTIETLTSTQPRFNISRDFQAAWGPTIPGTIQRLGNLAGMMFIFALGSLAMWFAPQFAYSIGSGVMMNVLPSPRLPRPNGGGDKAGSPAATPPDLGVSMNPPSGAIPQPSPQRTSLPPPAPAPLGS